ncbi:tyrosine-type recombinase/integrase [Gordonia westfalica]|uniref:Site-specific recombinase XerD n=1 Tax=Gordonia westfalica TaxID=158898 RepID=A0A1H2E6M7_9ACTN|nr:site-specific integrase [Gordonia westfalica]SDT87739.1 Site-specific recombinase XerD [Gordonia westfalica]SDT90846.1 Site-specific recombinase XerD [Gordonia westfalica]SDT91165.1 Site-specific recombinase XerD [Gordonia westfalica]
MPPKKRRRAKGEGGLYQRADGMWMAQVLLPDGKYYQRGRKKYADAVAELAAMRKDLANGILPNAGQITVAQWLDYWVDTIAAPRLKPRTLATYRSTIKHQLIPHVGSKKLGKLTPTDVRRMVNHVADAHTTRTAQAAYSVLAKALGDAVKDGKIGNNPCERMDRPQARSEERVPLTVEQARAVLLHVASRDATDAARWSLALLTGARQAEALGLTWDRVDLGVGVIDISWQLARLKLKKGPRPQGDVYPREAFDVPDTFTFTPVHWTACLVPTKTSGSRRLVPLLPPVVAALTELWEQKGNPSQGLVFTRDDGAAIQPRDDTLAWKQLCVQAAVVGKVEDAPDQHAARHTVATLLQEAGVEEATRMAILGHTTTTSHRQYAHTSTDLTRAALGQLEKLLALPDV